MAKRVEAFRSAQVAADAKEFDELCAAELSYSHSDGRVEDKDTFVKNATSGKSKLLSLRYEDPSIRVVGDVAIVRFHWLAESETIPDGKKNSTNLHILMNWQKTREANGNYYLVRPPNSSCRPASLAGRRFQADNAAHAAQHLPDCP